MSREYTTTQGDTFDIIAFKVLDNEKMMPALLEANPSQKDVYSFDAGVKISIPKNTTPINSDPVPPWQR